MKVLRTERLILRNWRESDRNLFRFINADDRVMEFFPFRRDSDETDAMMDHLALGITENGFGLAAVEIAETGETAGFTGLHITTGLPPIADGSIEIGWRLAPWFWGQGIVTEAARRWLEFGFEDLGLDEIISFAVWNNRRSTSVMERIGMTRNAELDFDHPKIPDSHPHLKRHVFYAISRQNWQTGKKA